MRVFITAGASGIGLAMAQNYAAQGADVAIADANQSALDSCPDSWHKFCIDVTDEKRLATTIHTLESLWSGIDVLCANAGIAGPTAAITDIELNDWQRCVAVNLEGAFLAAKHTAPIMKTQKSGVMLFTSSTAGQYGYPNRAAYSAAKWGIIGLMKTIAMELGPFGTRANAICPGAVEGERMEGVLQREAKAKGTTKEAIYQGYAAGTSMRAFVSAQDIADMAFFLSSPQAKMVSGQVIAIDGHTENPNPKV